MSLLVHLGSLEKGPVRLQGELPSADLDLETLDELIRANRPLRYDLEVQKDQQNLLVQGTLEMQLDCECGRCLRAYTHEIRLDGWACLVPLEGEEGAVVIHDSVDLTPYVREDMVLALPQHPLCGPDCPGVSTLQVEGESGQRSSGSGAEDSRSSPWSELDKLKFDN